MRAFVFSLAAVLPLIAADPVPLFNGKDLTGWTMVGPGQFVVENGLMKTEGGMGLLYYNGGKIGNQTLRVVFKTTGDHANSGVVIRMPEPPPDPWCGVHNGYEVQIDAAGDEWHSTGAIYSLSKVSKRASKPAGEWNTMDIQLDGLTTRITLNGEMINEFKPGQTVPDRKMWYEPVRGPRPEQGYIGLQNHDPKSTVYFKDVSVIGGSAPQPAGGGIARDQRNRMLSHFHGTRKQVLDLGTAGLTPEQWNFKPAPDKWSIRDVVEHLVLSEETIFNTATAGLTKSAAAPSAKVEDEVWVKAITDRSRRAQAPEPLMPSGKWQTPEALLDEFRSRRDRNLEWIRQTQANLRDNYVAFGPRTVDIYQALLLVPAHVERHLAQVAEIKADSKFPK